MPTMPMIAWPVSRFGPPGDLTSTCLANLVRGANLANVSTYWNDLGDTVKRLVRERVRRLAPGQLDPIVAQSNREANTRFMDMALAQGTSDAVRQAATLLLEMVGEGCWRDQAPHAGPARTYFFFILVPVSQQFRRSC